MSQDVNYATKLAHACAPYKLKWIEECLPPQQYEGYRELKRQAPAGMMVTLSLIHISLRALRSQLAGPAAPGVGAAGADRGE